MANAESLVHFWAENISKMANPTTGEFGVRPGDGCLLKGYPRFCFETFLASLIFSQIRKFGKKCAYYTKLEFN
jgi:hypothetical protein